MLFHLRQWLQCLKQYVLMCVFASGPERLPFSPSCIATSIFCYLLLGLTLVNESRGYAVIGSQILLEIVLLSLVAYLGLKWKNSLARFAQTLSALIGVNLVISIISIPLLHNLNDPQTAEAGIEVSLVYATLLLVFWSLAVLSNILRQAFEVSIGMAALITFNYFLLDQFLVAWIY